MSPDARVVAVGNPGNLIALLPVDGLDPKSLLRLLPLDKGWAAFRGDDTYTLTGDPAGRFWWSAGLCRFEPGELDGVSVTRVDADELSQSER